MAGKKGMRQYPLELKLEAMRLFYEEGKTRKEITELLEIRSPGRVKRWLQQFRAEGEAAFLKKKGRPRKAPESENSATYITRLEMENELLKKYHTELRKAMLAKRNIGSSTNIERSTR